MNIAIQEAFVSVSAATAAGVLTVADNSYLFPGANAWVTKDDGSLSYRVKILAATGSNTIKVRRWKNDDENSPQNGPSYGTTDMSAFNSVATHICQEAQNAPIDPAYFKRVLP